MHIIRLLGYKGKVIINGVVETDTRRYTINAVAGVGGTVSGAGDYNENSLVTLSASASSGYTFDGWYENNIKITEANAMYQFNAIANRTLEARFVEAESSDELIITFDTGEGSSIDPLNISLNSLIPRPANPTLTDKLFVEWYKDSSFTNVWLFDEDKVLNDMALYAKWIGAPEADSGIFKVIINPLNRREIIASDVTSGDTMAKPSDPTRNGYTFSGWYLDYNCTIAWAFSSAVMDNMTLYSKWIRATTSSSSAVNFAGSSIIDTTPIDPFVYENTPCSNTTSETTSVTSGCGLNNAVINARNVTIKAGDKFNIMNGVTAKDDGGKGEDLTKKITVRGTINTHKPGKYNLTYSVKGCNGNRVSKTITVK